MYPMTKTDFDYWLKIFREDLPNDSRLGRLYETWYPYSGPAWRPGRERIGAEKKAGHISFSDPPMV